jgi:hypothetical protein
MRILKSFSRRILFKRNSVHEWIILKWIVDKYIVTTRTGFMWIIIKLMAGFFRHGYKTASVIEGHEFRDEGLCSFVPLN